MHTEESLDILVADCTQNHPPRGEKMVLGMIRAASDESCTRAQVRASILNTDEGGLHQRRVAFLRRLRR